MRVRQTIPILRIFSMDKAKEFYLDYLGFSFDWDHRFDDNSPAYIQVRRDDLVLHLTEHHGDCCPGSAVFVEMEGVVAFNEELRAKDYRYLKPGIERPPWGGACVSVLDPFGNRLLFNDRTATVGSAGVSRVGANPPLSETEGQMVGSHQPAKHATAPVYRATGMA